MPEEKKNPSYLFWILVLIILGWVAVRQAPFCPFRASPRETPVVKVVREWSPAVVNIGTERIMLLRQNPFWSSYGTLFDDFFQEFFQRTPMVNALKLKSVGSGVVLREDGLIVTNAHVVHMTSKVYVVLNDGTTMEAATVLVNPESDLALLQVRPPKPLKKMELIENPDDMQPGETVVSMGNPYGLENTVTVGVVSGKNRTLNLPNMSYAMKGLIQVDAPINPGSSGGALLNLEGKLIGINLAVVMNAQNLGFAVSSAEVQKLLDYYEKNAGT